MSFAVIKITGEDSASFIEAQSSNSTKKLSNAAGEYVSFLSPQGKIKGLAYLIKNSDQDFSLITRSEKAEEIKAHLEKFVIIEELELKLVEDPFSDDISIEDYSESDTLIKLDVIDKYVDFEKGCFPGQEMLSKYKNVGLKKKEERSQKYTEEALEIFAASPAEGEEAKAAHEKSIELLKKAIQENPKNEDAYESLGVILGREQKYEEAIKVMKQLEMINPASIMAQTNLSIFYMKIGDKETAEEYKAKGTVLQFEQALKSD